MIRVVELCCDVCEYAPTLNLALDIACDLGLGQGVGRVGLG